MTLRDDIKNAMLREIEPEYGVDITGWDQAVDTIIALFREAMTSTEVVESVGFIHFGSRDRLIAMRYAHDVLTTALDSVIPAE